MCRATESSILNTTGGLTTQTTMPVRGPPNGDAAIARCKGVNGHLNALLGLLVMNCRKFALEITWSSGLKARKSRALKSCK